MFRGCPSKNNGTENACRMEDIKNFYINLLKGSGILSILVLMMILGWLFFIIGYFGMEILLRSFTHLWLK